MYILSLDQASKTGWALIDEYENIVDFGVIQDNKIKDYDIKINFIKNEVIKLIKKYKPILVTVEGVFAMNKSTHHKLSKMQGVLINYFIDNKILYEVIAPSKWKGALGFKKTKRKEEKLTSINYIKEEKFIDTKSDDIADAVCMAIYSRRNIKIETTTI